MGRKTKKKNDNSIQSLKAHLNHEVYGIVTTATGLILLVGMYSNAAGKIGHWIKVLLMGLFSNVAFLLPYIIIFSGIMIFINKSNWAHKKQLLFYSLILFSILVLKSLQDIELIFDIMGNTVNEVIVQSFAQGIQGNAGGLVGTTITLFLVSFLGSIGTYIFIFTLLLICVIIYTKISLLDFLVNLKSAVVKCYEYMKNAIINFIFIPDKQKDLVKSPINGESTALQDVAVTSENNTIEEKIRILDFTSKESGFDSDGKEVTLSKDHNNPESGQKQRPQPSQNSANLEVPEIPVEHMLSPKLDDYTLPQLKLLNQVEHEQSKSDRKKILSKAKILEETLKNFGVEASVIQVSKGPSITRYELQPKIGVKVSKIVNLSDDIALNLAAASIRIEAPIPGKAAIGIEIPNDDKSIVTLREVLDSEEYEKTELDIPFALGKGISGNPIITDITKMPHLLIAGATGSGKSVCINTLILSILYNATPDKVRLLMIDPKVVELNQYNGIPHLLIPVVTDPKKATSALNWAVQEMTRRYKLFAEHGARDINGYNEKISDGQLPFIVIIIDELADLMMVAANDVEDAICRLAQMARAAGLHLIIATQRPSVDVITGVIKANIPSRIAFSVASQIDSRTILDMGGAEKLLGKGDMLFYPSGANKPLRVQGAFVSEKEVERVVSSIKEQVEQPNYEEDIIDKVDQNLIDSLDDSDDLLNEALKIVIAHEQASISMLQRKLRIGYNRAARLIDEMENKGLVGPHEGSKPRQVLVDHTFLEEQEKGKQEV
ncbi:cell division protein FtsK/SpoIIIE [Alkaliphilus metalliredigens QYMF]|uniref:Cell division protein FtsK/SpoIIIE n=1 Tax=Alkaliphilus metalliredigens (strain QYMF) TaxID=293826 RepID=A6TRJ6_ALKMQ|nr:DNA translocase FtsK [Alkaliphilus metalliredigens]ABR48814.1 cell division protein FtsK/SpoIIIE [Alkaliphilus metalliredigens QYMF]